MQQVTFTRDELAHMDKSPCPVCARILAVYNAPYEAEAYLSLGEPRDVLNGPCPHVQWIREVKAIADNDSSDEFGNIYLKKAAWSTSASFGYNSKERVYSPLYKAEKLELVARGDRHDHRGRSVILDPEWIDMDVVRSWYSCCAREHGTKCSRPRWTRGMETFRPDWLIDVIQGCIVPFTQCNDKYLTLSYTWGQAKNLRSTAAIFEKLRHPASLDSEPYKSQIPETVRNAFEITKRLGERFLWVDSLCILQDEEEDIYRNLSKMHLIFANASICIVAYAGEDANYGIRGIKGASRPRSIHQIVHKLADGEHLTGFKITGSAPAPPTSRRSYRERAWTFQEFLCSKRRLIFTQDLTMWHCECAGWQEDLNFHASADADNSVVEDLGYSSLWLKLGVPDLLELTGLIATYNTLALTYPEDVLRAFLGMQSMLHKVYPGGLLFGHPEFFFDISLAWESCGDLQRRHPSANFTGDPQNDNLPSWSWMGWQGRTNFPWNAEFFNRKISMDCGFTEPATQWFSMATPSSTKQRHIASLWSHYRNAAQKDTYQPPEGWKRLEYIAPTDGADIVPTLPRNLPRYSFVHTSDREAQSWFPVPMLPEEEDTPSPDQTQYLCCTAARAFLFPGHVVPLWNRDQNAVEILNSEGLPIGALWLHRREDGEMFAPIGKVAFVELIEIARGWTTKLPRRDRIRVTADEYYATPRERSAQGDSGSEDKEDCRFVLWIKWVNGVAYRQASGRVLAWAWNKYKEDEPVKVILG